MCVCVCVCACVRACVCVCVCVLAEYTGLPGGKDCRGNTGFHLMIMFTKTNTLVSSLTINDDSHDALVLKPWKTSV